MKDTAIAEDRLRELIGEMVKVKEAMNEQRDRLVDLRREARAEGLNIQALNPLIEVMGEHSHDGGSRVLNEIIAYAQACGTALDVAPASRPAEETAAAPSGAATEPSEQRQQLQPQLQSISPAVAVASQARAPRQPWFDAWGRGLCHVALAISVSAGLLWLLR